MLEGKISGQAFEIKIRRLAQARDLSLRIYADASVVLTVPQQATRTAVDHFLLQHYPWVVTKRLAVVQKLTALTAERQRLLFRGRYLNFRLTINRLRRPGVKVSPDTILVTAPREDDQAVRRILENWYRQQAKEYFTERLNFLANKVGQTFKRLVIRSQRTRWGSCSCRRTISLNWRLILVPDKVSDSIIFHELAHLTYLNHSPAFWQLLASYDPSYREAKRWLRDHHQQLVF